MLFRTGTRAASALRSSQNSLAPARTVTRASGRRYLTTEPPHLRSRSWKSSALRWGVAGAAVYYYNTSPVFAEYPQNNLLNPNVEALDDDRDHPTIDHLTASSRNRAQKDASVLQSAVERASDSAAVLTHENAQAASPQLLEAGDPAPGADGAAELEQEAEGEGAFNPVTGEINWDCPCLGGMAYGPCGEEFRTAFSCFVFSTQEPKGIDCVEKFQGMQDCFRAHPEVYQGELEDDETLDAELAEEREKLQGEIAERRKELHETGEGQERRLLDESVQSTSPSPPKRQPKKEKASSTTTSGAQSDKTKSPASSPDPQSEGKTHRQTADDFSAERETDHGADSLTLPKRQVKGTEANAVPESDYLVPKAAHDATEAPADSQSTQK